MMHYTEEERRTRETEAVVNKWRERTCVDRAKRELIKDAKATVAALLVSTTALAIWAVALALMVGAAAAR